MLAGAIELRPLEAEPTGRLELMWSELIPDEPGLRAWFRCWLAVEYSTKMVWNLSPAPELADRLWLRVTGQQPFDHVGVLADGSVGTHLYWAELYLHRDGPPLLLTPSEPPGDESVAVPMSVAVLLRGLEAESDEERSRIQAARELLRIHGGDLPDDRDQLIGPSLPFAVLADLVESGALPEPPFSKIGRV